MTVTPSRSTTYTLIASEPGATTITAFVHVVVNCGGAPCVTSKRRTVRK